MKRKSILLIAVMLITVVLNGCGGDAPSEEETRKAFTLMDECKKASPQSGVVQIDDIVTNVNLSTTASEFMDALGKGKDKDVYDISDYNKNMLVAPTSAGKFVIGKNAEDYIYVHFWNITEKTTTLEKCYICGIQNTAASSPNYWIGGGFSLDTSKYDWGNIIEELNAGGFKEGEASSTMEDLTPKGVYEDESSGTTFKYNLEITYDETFESNIISNEDKTTSYFQYSHYIISFEQQTQKCIGIEFQGSTSKNY